jgi:hypothetical protein
MTLEFDYFIEQLDVEVTVQVFFETYHYRGDYDNPSEYGVTDVEIQLYIGKLNVTDLIKSKYYQEFQAIEDEAAQKAVETI